MEQLNYYNSEGLLGKQRGKLIMRDISVDLFWDLRAFWQEQWTAIQHTLIRKHQFTDSYPCSSKYQPGAIVYSFKVQLDQRIIPGPQTSHSLPNPMQYQSHYKNIIPSVKCILVLSY